MGYKYQPTTKILANEETLQVHVYRTHHQMGWIAKVVAGFAIEQTFPNYRDISADVTRELEIFAFGSNPENAVEHLTHRLSCLDDIAAKRLEVKGDFNAVVELDTLITEIS